jgi:hypothetical protein
MPTPARPPWLLVLRCAIEEEEEGRRKMLLLQMAMGGGVRRAGGGAARVHCRARSVGSAPTKRNAHALSLLQRFSLIAETLFALHGLSHEKHHLFYARQAARFRRLVAQLNRVEGKLRSPPRRARKCVHFREQTEGISWHRRLLAFLTVPPPRA